MVSLIAPCGIDCSICEAYIATKNNDMEMKQKLADNFMKQFNKDIDPSTINCVGCNQDGLHIGFCAQCAIRACSVEKGFKTCAECDDFPCPKGSFIWVDGSKSKATLEGLKKRL